MRRGGSIDDNARVRPGLIDRLMEVIVPRLTILFALGLAVLGVVTWLAAGQSSITALIPAFFAAPLALAGLAARREGWRKHAMHAAALIALLGAGGALSRAIPGVLATGELRLASVSQLLMGAALLVYLALCVRSFILARRAGAV